MTRWSLATCGCCLEYKWDNAKGPKNSDQDLMIVSACPAHIGWNAKQIARENERLMETLMLAQEINPEITHADLDYAFDADRKLNVIIHKLTAAQKKQLKSICDSKLERGKVQVV